jgi:hypothetical protein
MNKRTAKIEMNKMRKIYENLGKELIGQKPLVVMSDAFWFDFKKEIVAVAIHIPSDEFETLINGYFESIGTKGLNPYTVGFLHELGHLWAKKVFRLTNAHFEKGLKDAENIDAWVSENNLSFAQGLEMYYQIQNEFLANEFVKVAVASKRNTIEKYDALISEYYVEM